MEALKQSAPVIDPAQHLRNLLRQAAAEVQLEGALEQLEQLLDAALQHAELDGIRMLARTVPHELAQPLAEVRGYAELLAEGGYTPDQQREFLERIAAAATRAGGLTHAIGRLGRSDQPPPQRRRMGGQDLLLLPPEDDGPVEITETAVGELRRALLRRLDAD
jgi:signal transduction histidine kinase